MFPDRGSLRSIVVVVAICGVTPAARAQSRVWSFKGDARDDQLGSAIVAVPDIDGDGVPDFLVGSPSGPGYYVPGRSALHSGASGALIRERVGDPGDYLGASVAHLGDVDGDGVADVAIAASSTTYVDSGATGAPIYSVANQHGLASLASLGDLDGDGARDLIVASGYDQASVYSGKTGSFLRQHFANSGDRWGAVGSAGDVDGDGIDDYIVGATRFGTSNGSAFVYSGAAGGLIWTLSPSSGQQSFGTCVSGAGDVNGDGFADLVVGNPWWLRPSGEVDGRVWLFSGATGAELWSREAPSGSIGQLGSALSVTGDFDGDGVNDLAVGCGNTGFHSVVLFSGASGADIRSYNIHQNMPAGAIDATTDFTGDGIPDLLVGLPKYHDPLQGSDGGAAVAVDQASRATLFEVFGEAFISQCGSAMAVLPDRDGDGHHEVAVGLPGGLDDARGTVRVLSGKDGHELARTTDAIAGTRYGAVLTPLDDVNGDGVRDYAVGAPGMERVTILSGIDDSTLTTLNTPLQGNAFGTSLSAGTDAAGGVLLAVGAPDHVLGKTNDGQVYVYDAKSGALVQTLQSPYSFLTEFGMNSACLGDVDGDGMLDWIVGAPDYEAVLAVSGATGNVIWTDRETTSYWFGARVAAIGDLNGDGTLDVAVGCPVDVALGHVTLLSGRDGAVLSTLSGSDPRAPFGEGVGALGDVNGDGVSDFAVAAVPELDSPGTGHVHLYSGATTGLLDSFANDGSTWQFGGHFATTDLGSDTRIDPDPIPDLLIGSIFPGTSGGTAELRQLHQVFLQIDPEVAFAGQSVAFATRGGPSGNLVGLDLVAINGVATQIWLAFGAFGIDGNWNVTGTAPPGLSGTDVTLRSYAIGFSGKIVDSSDATLTFN